MDGWGNNIDNFLRRIVISKVQMNSKYSGRYKSSGKSKGVRGRANAGKNV